MPYDMRAAASSSDAANGDECYPLPHPIEGNAVTAAESAAPPLYVDIAALLAGGLPDPPEPAVLYRDDGHAIFYRGQVNQLFGDPESGKTLVALGACVAELDDDNGRAVFIDIDHNGVEGIVSRLLDMGADADALSDPNRFRYAEPEDAAHLALVVADLCAWEPTVAVVDSVGELLPLLRLSSNSPDDSLRTPTS